MTFAALSKFFQVLKGLRKFFIEASKKFELEFLNNETIIHRKKSSGPQTENTDIGL